MSVLEPGRPACDFEVAIVRDHSVCRVPATALQDVYDIAINSMDFGSGFLSTEEVRNLRILGGAIGAEPLHYQCEYSNKYPTNPLTGLPRICTCGASNE